MYREFRFLIATAFSFISCGIWQHLCDQISCRVIKCLHHDSRWQKEGSIVPSCLRFFRLWTRRTVSRIIPTDLELLQGLQQSLANFLNVFFLLKTRVTSFYHQQRHREFRSNERIRSPPALWLYPSETQQMRTKVILQISHRFRLTLTITKFLAKIHALNRSTG